MFVHLWGIVWASVSECVCVCVACGVLLILQLLKVHVCLCVYKCMRMCVHVWVHVANTLYVQYMQYISQVQAPTDCVCLCVFVVL